MVQSDRAIEQAAGEVHGKILDPHSRIPARRDGPEAERVDAGAAGGARRDTARIEHRPGCGFKERPHVGGDQGGCLHRVIPFMVLLLS